MRLFGRPAALAVVVSAVLVGSIAHPALAEEDLTVSAAGQPVPEGEETADSSAEEELRAAAQLAVDTGVEVEVESLTSPTTRTYASADGTLNYEESSVPVRVEQGDDWVDINTDLVLRDGWWEPKASATPVRFSAGGTTDLDMVRTSGGEWLTEAWPHEVLPEPLIDGPTATYVEVLPGVDLKLTATELGMASVYVVKSEKSAMSEVLTDLHVVLDGADVTKDEVGSFIAEASNGETITASSPLWWDSSDGGDFLSPGEDNPAMPVEHTFSDSGINMDVTETIKDEDPTYPIFVDPDWAAGTVAAWYTDEAYPNQSYLSAGASDVLRVGRYNPYRGNMFFEFNIGAIAGKQILGAQLSTTQIGWAACPNNPLQVRTFGPQAAGFTWNQQNHNLWGPVLDTRNPGSCGSGPETVGWNVVAGVQSRVGQPTIQFGFAPQDENVPSRRHFSRAATLTVNYNSPPNTPTDPKFVTPSATCGTASAPRYISASSVTVSVHQTDPDPGNVDVNFDLFRVQDLNNRVQNKSPGLAAQGTKTVTFTGLVDGQAYAWRARGSDWMIDGNGYSPWCYFTIDRTGPSAPTVAFSAAPHVVGNPMTATMTTKVSDHVKFIAYTVASGANATSFVFDVFNAPPACGSSIGFVRIVCPNASGVATATFAPIEANSTLLAIPYDEAGNPGVIAGTPTGQAGRVGAKYPFASINSPQASFASGHAWMTQTMSSPLPEAVPDSNGSQPSTLLLGARVNRFATDNPIAPAVPIPKPVLSVGNLKQLLFFSNGFGLATSDRILYVSNTPADGPSLYTCSGLATYEQCQAERPDLVPSLTGHIWGTQGPGMVPITQCLYHGQAQWSVVRVASDCPANAALGTAELGYVYLTATPPGATETTSSSTVVTPSSSFSAGAWIKPTAGGANETLATYGAGQNFSLGSTSTQWEFCMGSTCVQAPRSSTADWTHVMGVWDSVNRQMRLYVNASIAATGVYEVPVGTTSAPKVLHVAVHRLTPFSPYTGSLADPAVFPAVLTPSQIGSLRAGQDPAFG